MRAVARTTLELGDLLKIPVGIVPATGSRDVRFDTAFPDGTPRVQQYVHPVRERTLYQLPQPDATGEVPTSVPFDALAPVAVPEVVHEAVKGVRVGDDFRVIPPSEIEYAEAVTHLEAVELLEFIDYRRVPTDRLSGFFYVQPDPGFAKSLRTIIEAMRHEKRAMLVKFTVRKRQRLGVIRAREDSPGKWILVLNGVAFAAEVRAPDERVLEPAMVEEVDERSVEAARRIIRAHSGPGETLDTARDELPDLLGEIARRAQEGIFDDPVRVLMFAADIREAERAERSDGHTPRADGLVEWAEARWPRLVEQRTAITRVLAEGGADVDDRLADLAQTILA
jgi:non-homologous end joining protein Ku